MSNGLPRVSKKGFELAGDRAHIVLFHGYTGSPYDLRPLGNFLHRHGYHVIAPLLKGHGTKPEDLIHVMAEDWLEQTERVLRRLDEKLPVVVGGLSMGGLIATIMAAHFENIRGACLFSPSFRLNLSAELMVASARLKIIDKNSIFQKLTGGSDVFDPIAKQKTPAYKALPIAGLLQLERLRMLAKQELPRVMCPLFLAFGRYDGAINIAESNRIALTYSSQTVYSKVYESSKHIVTLDYDRDELFADVLKFLTQRLGI